MLRSDQIKKCEQIKGFLEWESEPCWWLAINGNSCAASPIAFPQTKLRVSPEPELLIGYYSQEEQCRMQAFFLEAKPIEIKEYLNKLPDDGSNANLEWFKPENPQPPAAQTTWSSK